jgi:Fe-S-cluster containining protein
MSECPDVTSGEDIDSGDFGTWLDSTIDAIESHGATDVPCGSCTACCRSSQFILIEPTDVDARAHIDQALLFDAPNMPAGFSVLGYDESGHCPMLVEDSCSIYAHRPRTCRTYDCRVFTATGLMPTAETKVELAHRSSRWVFDVNDGLDTVRNRALSRAGNELTDSASDIFGEDVPEETQLAALAIRVHDLFLDPAESPTAAQILDRLNG